MIDGLNSRPQHEDPRPLSTPTLALPRGGPAAFIVFPDLAVMTSITVGKETKGGC
jgi:hypothetical protein